MRTSFYRIQTKDYLELHGLLYQPNKKTDTVLAHVHGMAGNFYENKWLDRVASVLTENNIAFCPFNNRGNGHVTTLIKREDEKISYSKIGNAYEKFEDCLIDIESHINFLEKEGFKNIHLSGHSLGAPKVAYYASKTKDNRLKSVIFLSPSDMLGLVRDNKENFKRDIAEAEEKKRNEKGNELMTHDVWDEYPVSADTYLSLFSENSEVAVFNFHKSEDEFKTLSQIPHPIFALMGRKDDVLVVPIEKIMEIIEEGTKSSSKCKTEILGDADHGYNGYEKELAESVLNWLQEF